MKNILQHYITCALWSSIGTASPEDLTLDVFRNSGLVEGDDYPLDDFFDESNLAPSTLETMEAEIADFLTYCEATGTTHEEWSDEQLGHDFWLTRNGHGAGFWDRGLAEGDALTAAAKTFGNVDLYVGDDGLIYQG